MSLIVNRRIAAPVGAVWHALTDPDALARADNGITSIEGTMAEGNTIRITAAAMQGRGMPVRIVRADTERELALEHRMPLGLFKAKLAVFLTPAEEETDVEVSIATSGLMGKATNSKLERARPHFDRFLDALEEEAGRKGSV